MLKAITYAAAILLAAVTSLFAQETATLSGTLNNSAGQPFADGLVLLHTVADSTLVKTEITDEKGQFFMDQLQKGNYFVTISINGLPIYSGTPFYLGTDTVLEPITVEDTKALEEVVVSRQKQYIERQQDKLVLNVQAAIGTAGSTAFEILEKAPTVSVDNNDNISLRGRGGIAVQVDGRAIPMTGANLANYLKGIPAGNIEKIELVNNPSAKYDAAGSSIINIILKKDKNMGTNGSITSAYGQGAYAKFNNSLSLNHRTQKANIYGTYSNALRQGFNDLELTRRFYDDNNAFTGAYEQDNYTKIDLKNHAIRAGADFYPNAKHTFGVVANAGMSRIGSDVGNQSLVYDASNTYVSRFETTADNWEDYDNYAVNLNHRFVMDTIGSSLVSDLDYARYNSKSNQDFATRYYDTANNPTLPAYLLFGDIAGTLDIFAGKSDYKTTLNGKYGLEAGIKASYVEADNDQAFFDRSNGGNVPDPTKSNHFIYKENINAAYVSTSGQFGKWSLQLGLRVEKTNIRGEQVADNSTFDNNYTQLFPNIFAGYAFNEKNSLDFSYSRRITRAGYDQLNPFRFFLDPTTYREGNPYLQPQTTHSIDITHTYDRKFFTTFSFSRTTNNITQVIMPTEEDAQLTAQTFRNLKTVDYYILEFIVPLQLAPWWSSSNNVNMYYGSYSGTAGMTNIRNQGNFTANMNSVNTFKVSETFSAELSGNYRFREIYAFMDVKPVWSLNIGCQKRFGSSTLKLAFNDMFYRNNSTADVTFDGYKEHFLVKRDSRQMIVSYTYNFGNGAQNARRRAGAADDIKQRASSGNA